MNAKDFLKQKGILDYNEFVSYQKADSDDYIPIEELLEEYAGIQVKTCNKPAVIKAVCDECDGSGWWKENEIDNVIVCPKCKGKQTDL